MKTGLIVLSAALVTLLAVVALSEELPGDGVPPPPLEPMAATKITATAICKCVGDSACGGGKIYRHDITVPSCQRGIVQRAADDYCNNDADMKKKCQRPRCYYRHTDFQCPKK